MTVIGGFIAAQYIRRQDKFTRTLQNEKLIGEIQKQREESSPIQRATFDDVKKYDPKYALIERIIKSSLIILIANLAALSAFRALWERQG